MMRAIHDSAVFVVAQLLIARLGHCQSTPAPGPTQPGTAVNCNKWHIVKGGDTCNALESIYKLSHAQFLLWNPAVSSDCLTNFWPDFAYCVGVDPNASATSTRTTSRSSSATSRSSTAASSTRASSTGVSSTRSTVSSSSTSKPASSTQYSIKHPITNITISSPTIPSETWPPQKTQAGQPSYCNSWHLVGPGDTCQSLIDQYDTWMGTNDFFAWNPALGTDCSGLYLYWYVCVGIRPQTSVSIHWPTGNGSATLPPYSTWTPQILPPANDSFVPEPTQGPLPTNCAAWYKARPGDTCRKILEQYKDISQTQFFNWHPFLNGNCDGLWSDTYYCVWAGQNLPEVPVETVTPKPVDTGIATDCKAWYQADGSITCEDFVEIFGRFSEEDFIKWNPALGSACANIRSGYWYCVAVPGTPTTRTTALPSATAPTTGPTRTPAPSSSTRVIPTSTSSRISSSAISSVAPVSTPQPTQDGMLKGCRRFYLVGRGDGCWAIANSAGIALADFYAWNPAIGECSALFPDFYVCIGMSGPVTTITSGPPVPT